MTVLLRDAIDRLRESMAYTEPRTFVSELVYADDTLVMAVDEDSAHAYMTAIAVVGQTYGLSFNWSKLEALPVKTHGAIAKPDGTLIACKQSIKYLGSSISADGRIDAEIGQRIGAAKRDFEALRRIWAHAQLPTQKKIRICTACYSCCVEFVSSALCCLCR